MRKSMRSSTRQPVRRRLRIFSISSRRARWCVRRRKPKIITGSVEGARFAPASKLVENALPAGAAGIASILILEQRMMKAHLGRFADRFQLNGDAGDVAVALCLFPCPGHHDALGRLHLAILSRRGEFLALLGAHGDAVGSSLAGIGL